MSELTYKDSGVDINKSNVFIKKIKNIVKQTPQNEVIGDIGGFSGLFSLNNYNKLKNPILVSGTDGVGTKLKIAFMTNKHDTIGIDLVAMCINDIIACGAKPLFFLDYLSTGKLEIDISTNIINGIVTGCKYSECSLIGGETAEMPGFYKDGEYDLAGFVIGIIDKDKIIDGSKIYTGNKIIGISSNGLHSNGYSLVRKICFDILKLKADDYIPEFNKTLGEELLTPTKIYSKTINHINTNFSLLGIAHITGGGIIDNIIRVIPKSNDIIINKESWNIPPIFTFLQKEGNISKTEMINTFNNGIGMVLIVEKENADNIINELNNIGEKSYIIGEVINRI